MSRLVRRSWLVSLTVVLLLSIIGCSEAKTVKIRFGLMADMAEGWTTEIVKEFEARNPGVEIVMEPVAGNYNTKIPVAILANEAPDVFQGWGENQRGWAQSGFLLDLEPYIQKFAPNAAKDFFPAQWNALKITNGPKAGMRYAIPMYVNVQGGILYNVDLFDQNGLVYPEKMRSNWTWDDLLMVAKKLTHANSDGVDRYGFGTITNNTGWISTWMWGAGGGLYADDNITYTGTSAASLRGLQFVRDLVWEHGVTPADLWVNTINGPQNGFIQGRLAMMHTYASWTQQINTQAGFNWNIAPNPIGPAGFRAALTVTDSFSVNAQTKNPDEAVQFALFLASRQANIARLRAPYYLIPSLPSLGVEYYKIMPQKNLRIFLESMDKAKVDPRTFFAKPVEMNALFVDAWTKTIVENTMTPEAGLRSIATALEALSK